MLTDFGVGYHTALSSRGNPPSILQRTFVRGGASRDVEERGRGAALVGNGEGEMGAEKF